MSRFGLRLNVDVLALAFTRVVLVLGLAGVVLRQLALRFDLFDAGDAQLEDVAQAPTLIGDGALLLARLRGDLLGLVGNSGASTAPHLHFSLEDEGGGAIRGRFTYEMRRTERGKWKRVNGGEIRQGMYIRNLRITERVPKRKREE